jgi:hypothetical protein
MKTPGDRIKHVRKNILGMSQTEFGNISDTSIRSIWSIENGDGAKGIQSIDHVVRAIGLNPAWVNTGRGNIWADGKNDQENVARLKAMRSASSVSIPDGYSDAMTKAEALTTAAILRAEAAEQEVVFLRQTVKDLTETLMSLSKKK